MFDSIPVSALELGIGFREYEDLARSVRDVASLKMRERQGLLDLANIFFSGKTILKMQKLVIDMADDREFYRIAEMNYSRGPPEGEGIFTTGLAYHLLKRGGLIQSGN